MSRFSLLPTELVAIIVDMAFGRYEQKQVWRTIALTLVEWQPRKAYRNPREILSLCVKHNPPALQGLSLEAYDVLCVDQLGKLHGLIKELGGSLNKLDVPTICRSIPSSSCDCQRCIAALLWPLHDSLQLIRDASPGLEHLSLRFHRICPVHWKLLQDWGRLDGLASPQVLTIQIDYSSDTPPGLRDICRKLVSKVNQLALNTYFNKRELGPGNRHGLFTEVATAASPTVEVLTMTLLAYEIPEAPFVHFEFSKLQKLPILVINGTQLGWFDRNHRGSMPNVHTINVAAAVLDTFHAPQIKTAVLVIHRLADVDVILRNLRDWKVLRSLRLRVHGKEMLCRIIDVLQGMIAWMKEEEVQFPSLEEIILTYHDDKDPPRFPERLSEEVDLIKLQASFPEAREFKAYGLRIVSQWGRLNDIQQLLDVYGTLRRSKEKALGKQSGKELSYTNTREWTAIDSTNRTRLLISKQIDQCSMLL